ncbi:MAG: PAS domain S-box protein, partial [Spirochaetales bacterium]|nr:PAS domain S-box protein [Spirochaetales bacterium]
KSLEEDIIHLGCHFRSLEYVNSGFDPQFDLSLIYGSFLKRRNIYSSVRIIDSEGFERYRMNYDGTAVTIISDKDLQTKGNCCYFNEIMNLESEDIYFSQMDFNYEAGKLQLPYEPVLRIARLFPDYKGNKRAFIVLNYRGQDILDLLEKNSTYSFGEIFLRNDEGRIISVDQSRSVEQTKVIDFLETDKGKQLVREGEGQLNIHSGYLTHKWVRIGETDTSLEWNLISFVDISRIKEQTKDASRRGIIVLMILSLVSLTISFFAVKNKTNRIKANLLIEERARIFDLNPAPVIKTSKGGEILSSNIAAKTILGLTATPPSIYNVFNKLSKQEINNINSDNINNFEYQIGQKTYYFTSIREVSSGQVFFYGTDITENFKIREELKNFQIAVKQSANVIVFTDLEGRILFANDAFEKITGYSRNEVLGQKPTVLNSGYHSDSFYKELWD